MNDAIRWPAGDFTIKEAVSFNSTLPEKVVRKKLSDGLAAKSIVQTQKGNDKVQGKFQVVK